MDMEEDEAGKPQERPFWVKLGLWGLPGRDSAWAFCWLCLAIGIGCIAYGFVDSRYFIGSGMLLAALAYYLSIRWVDQHGRW